jgi:hypothetical protein
MIYITLLDQFHPGIYSSQVIDVCDYLNHKYDAKIRIVAFLSIREISAAKPKLKALSPTAIVLPAFPGLKNFQLTSILLFFVCLFTGERVAICRNVFCTKMALRVKKTGLLKKIVMDGRGSLAAEIKEYDVFPVDYLRRNVAEFEKFTVNKSDFRMAVSQQLVEYWKKNYGYTGNDHVIIPCTLDRKYFKDDHFILSEKSAIIKKELGILEQDIVLVYSGSTAPWQSFTLLEQTLTPLLENNPDVKLMFLSKRDKDNERLEEKFKGRVFIKWLEHKDVLSYLHCADYGILIREQSDTNKVASPSKFAEYLSAGLKVLISENLGDFSDFVKEKDCGFVVDKNKIDFALIKKVSLDEKKLCFDLGFNYFRKESPVNDASYRKLLKELQEN